MAQSDFTRINTNIGALNALNSLKSVQGRLGVAQLRLATGKRINEAADDPAGLTIATKFQYRAEGLGVALDNIGDAKNMLAVAEGGLSKINDILIKMRDKSEQAASDTLGSTERTAIQNQLSAFADEINDIVSTTQWNGNKLLDGLTAFSSSSFEVTIQAGAETDDANLIKLQGGSDFDAVDTTKLGIGSSVAAFSGSVTTALGARTAVVSLTSAIGTVSARLQTVGTLVSRLTFREETLTTAKVNTEAAHSRIMNADMASEQLEATKLQILQQTATAMLSQANTGPQNLLSLFR